MAFGQRSPINANVSIKSCSCCLAREHDDLDRYDCTRWARSNTSIFGSERGDGFCDIEVFAVIGSMHVRTLVVVFALPHLEMKRMYLRVTIS